MGLCGAFLFQRSRATRSRATLTLARSSETAYRREGSTVAPPKKEALSPEEVPWDKESAQCWSPCCGLPLLRRHLRGHDACVVVERLHENHQHHNGLHREPQDQPTISCRGRSTRFRCLRLRKCAARGAASWQSRVHVLENPDFIVELTKVDEQSETSAASFVPLHKRGRGDQARGAAFIQARHTCQL